MQITFRWEKSKKGPADTRQATASTLPATARLFSSEILTCIAPCTAAAGSGHSTATRTRRGAGVRGVEKGRSAARRAHAQLKDQP